MAQNIAVICIVLVAGLYAAWYWMPRSLRRRMGRRLRSLGGGADGVSAAAAKRVAAAIEQTPGCASCESCGGCGTPGAPVAASDAGDAGDAASRTQPITLWRKPPASSAH